MENKMKKVLFLTNIPAPYTVKFFSLLSIKCDLTVLFERKTASNRKESWFSKTVNEFESVFMQGINWGEEAALCPDVLKYLRKTYDCIIVGNYSSPTGILAIEYMKMRKKKYYIHIDGGIPGNHEGLKYYLKKHLLSGARGFFSSGIITDNYIMKYVGRNANILHYPFSSVCKEDILKSPLPREVKIELRKSILDEWKMNADLPLIISVGSMIHRKGFDIFLKAVSKLNFDCNVLLVGGKPSKEILKCLDEKNANKVYFMDFVMPEKVKEYLQIADLFVFPTRYDIWGLVVNEALAAAVPVITSDMCIAGCELIRNAYNGYIFENENVENLAEMITLGLNNEHLGEMAINALKTVEDYTIENMSEVYADCIENFLNQEILKEND